MRFYGDHGANLRRAYWRGVVGEGIRQLRKSARMTQGQLAAYAGVSRPTIAALEKGVQACTVDQLVEIAEAIGCHVADFFPVNLSPKRGG